MKRTVKIYLLLLVVGLSVACTKSKNKPGHTFFPDMAYSPAYKTYSENPVFEDGQTMRLPAEGTIPRGFKPYPYAGRSMEEQVRAGQELENPLQATPEVLAEGKRQYEIFCVSCHGDIGDGNGHLFTSRVFPAKPRSLIDDYLKGKPDGEIYHVITRGSFSGLMGPHGGQISPENRWRIVHYVRSLAQDQNIASSEN
ncbi:c-type cytochrome [Sunxiuqinia rutila]|uniref:c-type cytochrome n=1 Tax=Sunxiuqinia rutila TaxID=1397841 RepID=UPI003D363863